MRQLFFFNTASRKREEFVSLLPREVSMYTCGPTIYAYAHIGNFRTFVFEDLLRRTLQFFGYQVHQVMNLTDVDDKTIAGALQAKVSLNDYTRQFRDAFFADLKTLNVQPAEQYPPATEHIPEMVQLVEELLQKGVAYRGTDGSIYYAIKKFPEYGKLSHLHMDELQVGAGGVNTSDEYEKENLSDFVLWKAYDAERDGQVFWETTLGKGRPGWHLECSAMALALLGKTIDIHAGGVDLVFPHHENEIAQSEAATGVQFARYWLHVEHLMVNGRKMSKSVGNYFTLRDLLAKGYTGPQIRYILAQTHYRSPLNFTLEGVEAAKGALQRLSDFIRRLRAVQGEATENLAETLIFKAKGAFADALADDLNISAALGALFEMVREGNSLIDQQKLGQRGAELLLNCLAECDKVLAFLPLQEPEETIPAELQAALLERQKARQAKDWARSDQLRDFIIQKGYLIEDTPNGPVIKKK